MRDLKTIAIPIFSLVILTLGSALLTTFLSLRLHDLGVNAFIVGGLSTAYYGGMVAGAFKLESIILRIGYIRTYAACASILAVTALLHGFFVESYFWLLLRFIEGIATAGLYIVIESWILSSSDNKNRGSTLAVYMIALYVAQSLGQWLLNLGDQTNLSLYAISALFAALSIIPLALIKTEVPSFNEPQTLSIRAIFFLSPTGVTTCLASGLILGSLYGLYPIYIQHLGYSLADISSIMGITIFGGMLFQYPIGKLSDHINRRIVIILLSFITILLCALLIWKNPLSLWALATISFFLGGAVFCLYPVGMSHACDVIDHHKIVSATQTLLLAYGIGATLGPIMAPLGNLYMADSGLLLFWMIICTPLIFYMLWRKNQVALLPVLDKQDYTLLAEMTPVAMQLDERAKVTDEK
jgi:MFS family permease